MLSSGSVRALEYELTESVKLSGNEQRMVFSPFQPPEKKELISNQEQYTLYEINYDELKRQIVIYQRIYVTGQLLHGYLMVKMKPKFVD